MKTKIETRWQKINAKSKTVLPLLGVFLLLFNGIGAIYGGSSLMLDPSGDRIGLSLRWLEYSPFEDYFFPGFVLLIFNGLSSLTIAVGGAMRASWFPMFILLQGVVLNIWLVVQINMIRYVYFLHYIMGTVAILMIAVGWICKDYNKHVRE